MSKINFLHFSVAKTSVLFTVPLFAAMAFTACGDDVTEVTEIRQEGMAVLEKGEKLSKQACDTTNVGEMLFVMDSSEAFICDGESWQTLKGEKGADGTDGSDGKDGKDGKDGVDGKDGLSCSAKYVIDKAKMLTGVALSCGESIVDTIWNGADGKDGDDGTNCSAKSVKNKAKTRDGIEVTCGETVVDTIWNGAKGDKGSKGDSGAGCEIVKDSAGVVTLACGKDETADTTTLFKATCGSIAFDPATHYCSEGVVQKYGYITDDRDGQIYKTVKIGNQVWMAENLNYDPNYLPKGAKDSIILSCCYNDSAEYCEKYGRLYTWAAAIDSVALANDKDNPQTCGFHINCTLPTVVQGVCPEGWHLPDTTEWIALFDAVGGKNVAGKMLKSANGWNDYEGSSGNGSDAYGFSALPAGFRINNKGYFYDAGSYANFWSASQSEVDSYDAYPMYLSYSYERAHMRGDHKYYGRSVRCLQN